MTVARVARPRALVALLAGVLLVASTILVPPAGAEVTGSISGAVTDGSGQPLSGVAVEVNPIGSGQARRWPTGDDGGFVASGLAAGSYEVCFYLGQALVECWNDIEPTTQRYTSIPVSEGEQVKDVDAKLAPSYLRGTVTDNQDEPVASAQVSATWYPPGDSDPVVACCQVDTTANDGSFEIGPLYSGEYSLEFSDRQLNRYATEWWSDAPTRATAMRIPIAHEESVADLDAVLDDLPHITGRVTGADGFPASGARVRVFEVAGAEAITEIDSSPLAADGSYDVGGLQPGTYRLGFDAAPGKYRSEYWHNVRRLGFADDVIITDTTSDREMDAVLIVAPPVRATRSPSLSGPARVGERLRVRHGTWDVSQLRFTYQWRADGVVLPRATGRTLRLTPDLRGKRIRVRVRATATMVERSPGVAMTGRTQPVGAASR